MLPHCGTIVHAFEGDGGKMLFFHNPRLYRAETSTPKEYVARLKAVREGSCKWQEGRACRPPWMDQGRDTKGTEVNKGLAGGRTS